MSSPDATHLHIEKLKIGETAEGECTVVIFAHRCLNPKCNELSLSLTLNAEGPQVEGISGRRKSSARWRLRPESSAKPQPDHIPEALRQDYYEACLIRDKSPKASATLARRCIQGMLHDFCGISERTLWHEIETLKKRVEGDHAPRGVQPEHIEAIDAVRKLGNIGAHMERDIDLIVDVDPGEAQALIGLIEVLFAEWYVARRKREELLRGILKIAADKDAAKLANPQIEAEEVAHITDDSDSD